MQLIVQSNAIEQCEYMRYGKKAVLNGIKGKCKQIDEPPHYTRWNLYLHWNEIFCLLCCVAMVNYVLAGFFSFIFLFNSTIFNCKSLSLFPLTAIIWVNACMHNLPLFPTLFTYDCWNTMFFVSIIYHTLYRNAHGFCLALWNLDMPMLCTNYKIHLNCLWSKFSNRLLLIIIWILIKWTNI